MTLVFASKLRSRLINTSRASRDHRGEIRNVNLEDIGGCVCVCVNFTKTRVLYSTPKDAIANSWYFRMHSRCYLATKMISHASIYVPRVFPIRYRRHQRVFGLWFAALSKADRPRVRIVSELKVAVNKSDDLDGDARVRRITPLLRRTHVDRRHVLLYYT